MVEVCTDASKIDLAKLMEWLGDTYWAPHRPIEKQRRAIENSLSFVAVDRGQMVGFARVVTDYSTFAWLCDVIVDPALRGQGIGKLMLTTILAHPDLGQIRRFLLGTRTAHTLYERFGWNRQTDGRLMLRSIDDVPVSQ